MLTFALDTALFLSTRAPKFWFVLTIDAGATVFLFCAALTVATSTPLSIPYVMESCKYHPLHINFLDRNVWMAALLPTSLN